MPDIDSLSFEATSRASWSTGRSPRGKTAVSHPASGRPGSVRVPRSRMSIIAIPEDWTKPSWPTSRSCQWINDHHNLIITGPTGTGKTFLACALAHKACREGYSSLYLRVPRLFQDLLIAKGDGRYTKLLSSYAKTDLLILDDWGMSTLTPEQAGISWRSSMTATAIRSTLITSQFPIEHWHEPHRRAHPGRCHPRSHRPQRLQDQPQRRVHAKEKIPVDQIISNRVTMKHPASLRSDQVATIPWNQVAGMAWISRPVSRGIGGRIAWNAQSPCGRWDTSSDPGGRLP